MGVKVSESSVKKERKRFESVEKKTRIASKVKCTSNPSALKRGLVYYKRHDHWKANQASKVYIKHVKYIKQAKHIKQVKYTKQVKYMKQVKYTSHK